MEYLLKLKKLKLFLSVRPSTALAGFFLSKYSVHVFDLKGLLSLVASIGTSRAEHTTFYMSYQQIETLLSVNHKTVPTMKVYLYPYIQAINLNLRRRCGQTEIVCHCSLLMLLAHAEQSIQLLTCHISR